MPPRSSKITGALLFLQTLAVYSISRLLPNFFYRSSQYSCIVAANERVNAMTGRVGAPSIPQQAGGPENLRWTAPNTSSSSLERTRPAGGHPARTDKRKYLWAGSLPSQASSDGQPLSGSHFLTTPLTTQRSEKARHERATSKRCHQTRIGPSPPPQPP